MVSETNFIELINYETKLRSISVCLSIT